MLCIRLDRTSIAPMLQCYQGSQHLESHNGTRHGNDCSTSGPGEAEGEPPRPSLRGAPCICASAARAASRCWASLFSRFALRLFAFMACTVPHCEGHCGAVCGLLGFPLLPLCAALVCLHGLRTARLELQISSIQSKQLQPQNPTAPRSVHAHQCQQDPAMPARWQPGRSASKPGSRNSLTKHTCMKNAALRPSSI